MMRWYLLIVFACLWGCQRQQEHTTSVAYLPIKLKEGYGPFEPGFGILGDNSREDPTWQGTYQPIEGVPADWEAPEVSHMILNTRQFVYQNYLTGNMPLAGYLSLQKSWRWTPDTARLSEAPIKCYVYVVRGYDRSAGRWAVKVDVNNNLDFGDETVLYPTAIDPKDPFAYKDPLLIQYEVYREGKIVAATLPLVLKTFDGKLLYNFPQHAVALFGRADQPQELPVSFGTTPDYERTTILPPSKFFSAKAGQNDLVEIDNVIELNGLKYVNKGVDIYTNRLVFKPVSAVKNLHPLQVGYAFRSFVEREFGTGRIIDLNQYRGRYVYVDFWATWCKGCVADMPALKKVYAGLDRNRVEFIGIANDDPKRLRAFIDKHRIPWSQILATNKLLEGYNIVGFPTSVLVDPEGNIIGKNLRPDELAQAVRQ